jgi:hypothetical protein
MKRIFPILTLSLLITLYTLTLGYLIHRQALVFPNG